MVTRISLLAFAACALSAQNVVFVTGDHEYGGEDTMPLLAHALESRYGMKTTVLYATRPDGAHDENYEKNIPGLEALEKADLAVFFLRWRQLPASQVALIEKYLESGKPAIGFRTTSHAFKYPKGDPLERWNAFGEFTFGTPPGWGAKGHTHCGHLCTTDVSVIPEEKAHPVLTGLPAEFHVPSWLYHVPGYPPPSATKLLIGHAVNPSKPMPDNPVAWTFVNQWKGRTFYTSLGHPYDFQIDAVQRLAVNAVHWALGKPVPKKWDGPYQVNVTYHGLRPTP